MTKTHISEKVAPEGVLTEEIKKIKTNKYQELGYRQNVTTAYWNEGGVHLCMKLRLISAVESAARVGEALPTHAAPLPWRNAGRTGGVMSVGNEVKVTTSNSYEKGRKRLRKTIST